MIEHEVWHLDEFAKLIGVSKKELREMETAFLAEVIKFQVHVKPEEFEKAKRCLEAYCALE